MPTRRRLIGRTTAGLLLIVAAAACSLGPDLNVDIDNSDGPKDVTVTVDSSAPDLRRKADVKVLRGEGAGWSVPLGSTWEVKVDGRHVIGSGDPAAPTLPSPGEGQDLTISLRVAKDGTVMLLDAP